ncbi:MAG: recombinase family protein [Chloroflexi bacterium]|nr:recombinase family protein [Chloroflexota bacterium]
MRVYIYARRSKAKKSRDGQPAEDEALSLAAQLRACRGGCAKRGWEVARELVEDDKSARYENPTKRVLFQQMMTGVEAGEAEVVIVHKLDRFSRNLRLTLQSLDRLARHNVGLVSVVENLDYSTPQGRLSLHIFGALAEFYSQNLGQEVRKVKSERKERGLYNGLLPFGAMRGEDGLPAPDLRLQANSRSNHEGLVHALEICAKGASDKEVAEVLNAGGWRTTGNRGHNPWRKDSVRRVLINRFYVGDLPDGQGGWVPGAHPALVDPDLFARAREARKRNLTGARQSSVNGHSHTYSLTGLLRCAKCGGAIRIQTMHDSVRTVCYGRMQGLGCDQRGVLLSVYEEQIGEWMAGLELPEGALEVELRRLQAEARAVGDVGEERRRLEARLARIKELYSWGDLDRPEYLAERDSVQRRLLALQPEQKQRRDLLKLAEFVRHAAMVWAAADPAQRNRLLT